MLMVNSKLATQVINLFDFGVQYLEIFGERKEKSSLQAWRQRQKCGILA